MKIQFAPAFLECQGNWAYKGHGVVLVKKEEHVEPLFTALCEQDDYWKSYKHLIKLAPEMVVGNNIDLMCEYCGKIDIYDIPKLKQKMMEQGIEFILYQTDYWD